jgi:hypothetical protein
MTREEEYRSLLIELQNRYQDVSAPVRHSYLMTTAMALADGFCLVQTGRRMTEDEFVKLTRLAFRKVAS